jgi:hypothetical protein
MAGGGSKEQVIRVVLDTSRAQQQAAAWGAKYAAGAQQRATADEKAAARSDAAYVKAIKSSLRAQKQLDDAAIKGAKQRADADAKASASSDAAYVRAVKAKLRAEKQLDDEKERAARRAQAQRDKDDAAYVRATMKKLNAQKQLEEESAKQESASTRAILSLGGYVTAAGGIAVAVSALKGMGEWMAQIRQDSIDAAKEVMGFRKEVLALAAMKGELGRSTPEVRRQLAIRGVTGQSQQDAIAMATQSEGAAQAAIEAGNITRAEYDKGYLSAAKLQQMEGIGAGSAYGDLFGTLAIEAKKGTTGADMAGQFYHEFRIQQPGKFASMGDFAKQRQELSGYVQNRMLTGDQASALLAGASLASNPQEAATHLRQGMASLAADPMRARKMKMMPGQDQETSAEYFQNKLKVDLEHEMPWDILQKVKKDLLEEEAKAKSEGKVWNADKYMIEHGLNNQYAREFYKDQTALSKNKTWEGSILPRMNEAKDPEAIKKIFAEREGSEPTILEGRAQAAEDAAKAERASTDPAALLQQLHRKSWSRRFAKGEIAGTFNDWSVRNNNPWWYNAPGDLMFGDHYNKVNYDSQESLRAEAKRLNLKLPEKWGGGLRLSEEETSQLQQMVQRAGGDPLAGIQEQIANNNQVIDSQEQLTLAVKDLTNEIKNNKAPAGPGGRDVHHAMPGKPLKASPPLTEPVH